MDARAEKAPKASEEIDRADADGFRAIFLAAAAGLARLDGPDLVLREANPALADMAGTDVAGLPGRPLADLFEDGPLPAPGGCAVLRLRRPGGALTVRVGVASLPSGALATIEDIDAASRAGAEARERAAQMETALAAADLGHWRRDVPSDRLELSPRAAALLDVDPDATPPWHTARENIDPRDVPRIAAVAADALARRLPYAVEYRLRRVVEGRPTWISARGQGIYDAAGSPVAMVGIVQDVTEGREARRALRDREERLRVATTAADLGIFEWHVLDDEALWENERMWEIFGRRRENGAIGKGEFFGAILHPEDVPAFRAAVVAAARGDGVLRATGRILRGDGVWRTIEMAGRIARRGSAGLPDRLIGVVADVTDRRRAEERQALLIRELHHRVKNTLATVQAIVGSTARTASSIESFYEAFVGRIMSLAHTHSVLTEDTWQTASLRTLLESELKPYGDGAMGPSPNGRISLDGPAVDLPSEIAVPIGMAIHELTTNAAKYGALSNRTGRVEITWRLDLEEGRRILDFAWRESGGPPVAPPTRQGFGSRLLQRVLTTQVQADVRATYEETGFRLAMRAPLPERNPALNPLA